MLCHMAKGMESAGGVKVANHVTRGWELHDYSSNHIEEGEAGRQQHKRDTRKTQSPVPALKTGKGPRARKAGGLPQLEKARERIPPAASRKERGSADTRL